MQDEERALIAGLTQGAEPAFAEVYDRYGGALYGYLLGRTGRPDVAEDMLQEVMVRLVRARAQLTAVESLRAYLFAMARNEWLRRGGRDRPTPRRAASTRAPAAEGARAELAAALARLEPRRAEVVAFKVHHGLTFREIGEVLCIPANTAASRYRYALRDLERFLGDDRCRTMT